MIAPIPVLAESALRSLLVALAVWAGLRAFRIGNVLAQKAAWGLVLVAALLMPLIAPLAARWQLIPAGFSLILPAHPLAFLAKLRPATPATAAVTLTVPPADSLTLSSTSSFAPIAHPKPAHFEPQPALPFTAESSSAPTGLGRYPAPALSFSNPAAPLAVLSQQPHPPVHTLDRSPQTIAWFLYAVVASALLFRLALGLAAAIQLWLSAQPVFLGEVFPQAAAMHLRSSAAIASPVTIGSAVVLPADYATWDAETLRIVLAHERSHIRQGDFYLQLLAGLYSALVWFSPLGWWIRRKLSDLAETISDRAGLEQAASHSSYAQILLQFAVSPRPTVLGVAMARPSSLSRRIERLLNPQWFRQAFEGTRRRALLAVLLVPAAFFAATAFVRVEAAGQAAQEPAAQPTSTTQPDAAITGQAHPDAAPASEADEAAQLAPTAVPEPTAQAGAEPAPAASPAPPVPPAGPGSAPNILPPLPPMPPSPGENVTVTRNHTITLTRGETRFEDDESGQGPGYSYHWSDNGDSYAVISGDGREHMTFSGDIHTGEIDKARKVARGAFLWFQHNGKSYVVDDPAIIARIQAMYAPIEVLGRQQEALGRQQEALGREQEEFGRQQEQVNVTAPDISKQMAEIDAAMAKLQAKMGKTITMDELADLQGQLGDLQGRLGALQGEMGARQGAFGAQQGKLGAEQGRLGAEQGKLGAEQGRLALQADRQIKSIIDQTLSNGKARPVQ